MALAANLQPVRSVAAAVRGMIRDGTLNPGDALPSSRDLSDELSVARNTVLAAFAVLLDEQLISKRWGGNYVVADTISAAQRTIIANRIEQCINELITDGLPPTRIIAVARSFIKNYKPEDPQQ